MKFEMARLPRRLSERGAFFDLLCGMQDGPELGQIIIERRAAATKSGGRAFSILTIHRPDICLCMLRGYC
jgi:hypothetical protein